jgi:hypothetical protein
VAWLTAKCPVSVEAQRWVQDSLQWLLAEFGSDALDGEMLLPASVFPPGSFSGTEASLRPVLQRLCTRMGIDIDAIQVDLSDDPDIPDMGPGVPIASQFSGAAGHFQWDGGVPVVALRRRQLRHPVALAATLAHELAHVRLLTERRVDQARKDHEQLTDLTTVFFGLGAFTANAAFDFSKSQHGWRASRLGYLGEELFGYSLAYYAYLRGEKDPSWARALDTNPRAYMRKGLRYLSQR